MAKGIAQTRQNTEQVIFGEKEQTYLSTCLTKSEEQTQRQIKRLLEAANVNRSQHNYRNTRGSWKGVDLVHDVAADDNVYERVRFLTRFC